MSPLEVVTFYQLTVETFKGDAKVIRKEKEKKIQKFIKRRSW